ncbi:MFS transporter [Flaviflexus equikiangi]|uniref:MFS transporter n=1 Tax=Flaviflexus equikiangi TaxID=2758573 RepID=A0ABS2TJP4_9ACTO|nr:hypothetical protein [Flaviflexus equikiangi]MBM9433997.1 hypothetical protein [Flaviflexus equikiangi]
MTTIVGTAVFTGGFFIAHTIASGWVGTLATSNRGEATGLCLTSFYLGSSIVGVGAGLIFHGAGWTATLGFLAAAILASGAFALWVVRTARAGKRSSRSPAGRPTCPSACRR